MYALYGFFSEEFGAKFNVCIKLPRLKSRLLPGLIFEGAGFCNQDFSGKYCPGLLSSAYKFVGLIIASSFFAG